MPDCSAVTQTLEKRDLNGRIARWSLELQSFDFKIIHRPGTRMRHVDALSRSFEILVVDDNPFEWNLTICQNRDSSIRQISKKLEKSNDPQFKLRNELVYKKHGGNLLFLVPEQMESHVLFHYHNKKGHVGIDKMIDVIRRTYWFPKIREKCNSHVRQCLKCISFAPVSGKAEGRLHPIEKGHVPFEMIHIDHFGPVDSGTLIKKYIFIIIDAFTKYVRLYPVKTTKSNEAITSLRDYCQNYSSPKIIISDRGSAFTSHEFKEFVDERGIKHIKIATGSPQANGRAGKQVSPRIHAC